MANHDIRCDGCLRTLGFALHLPELCSLVSCVVRLRLPASLKAFLFGTLRLTFDSLTLHPPPSGIPPRDATSLNHNGRVNSSQPPHHQPTNLSLSPSTPLPHPIIPSSTPHLTSPCPPSTPAATMISPTHQPWSSPHRPISILSMPRRIRIVYRITRLLSLRIARQCRKKWWKRRWKGRRGRDRERGWKARR